MTQDPYQQAPFRQVADLEQPLETMRQLLKGIALIAVQMDDDVGGVVQSMAWIALSEHDKAMVLRSELWDATHPLRSEKGGASS